MKKAFVLTALAAASTASFAQQTSSLTVYGILDAGVSQVSGLRGGTRKDVISGIMDGSRLGFRGNEDLGGGYRALFTLEHRLEVDTGDLANRPLSGNQLPDRMSSAAALGLTSLPAPLQAQIPAIAAGVAAGIFGTNHVARNMWDRQAFVGLVTPFGGFTAGRQYTPAYEVVATFDALGTQSSLSAGQVAAFPPAIEIRSSNTLAYRIQTGPITASLMVGAGERVNGRLTAGMGMYKTEAFSVGLGYNTRDNEFGKKALTSTALGGSVRLGPGTVHAVLLQVKDDNPSGVPALTTQLTPTVGGFAPTIAAAFGNAFKQDGQVSHVGYRFTSGPNSFYVAYTKLNDKLASDADVTSYGVAYSYWLSKRTALNAVATRFDNSEKGQAAPGQAGFAGGVTATAGTDSTSLALGIRHSF